MPESAEEDAGLKIKGLDFALVRKSSQRLHEDRAEAGPQCARKIGAGLRPVERRARVLIATVTAYSTIKGTTRRCVY